MKKVNYITAKKNKNKTLYSIVIGVVALSLILTELMFVFGSRNLPNQTLPTQDSNQLSDSKIIESDQTPADFSTNANI